MPLHAEFLMCSWNVVSKRALTGQIIGANKQQMCQYINLCVSGLAKCCSERRRRIKEKRSTKYQRVCHFDGHSYRCALRAFVRILVAHRSPHSYKQIPYCNTGMMNNSCSRRWNNLPVVKLSLTNLNNESPHEAEQWARVKLGACVCLNCTLPIQKCHAFQYNWTSHAPTSNASIHVNVFSANKYLHFFFQIDEKWLCCFRVPRRTSSNVHIFIIEFGQFPVSFQS